MEGKRENSVTIKQTLEIAVTILRMKEITYRFVYSRIQNNINRIIIFKKQILCKD